MVKNRFWIGVLAAAGALALGLGAYAQSINVPQVQTLNATDLIQIIPNGQPSAGNVYANQAFLQSYYGGNQPSRGNALIGGDATTNLFQRATTGSSVTTTTTYGGPDRWAYWSGASTAMTVSRDSTAADLPAAYQYAFKMARTSGQTGVVQVCMAQAVESANTYQFAGSTAELDFHAITGANFSAASSNMTAYIVYGTGSDEGIAKMAFGVNAGGGGGSGWTGQANATAAVISLGGVSTAGRYAAIASIPSTATEIGVALCFTPVGTASTNDYIAFSGIQLIRNSANAAKASATVGYNVTTNASTAGLLPASFERRPQAVETVLQQRYFYRITEATVYAAASSAPVPLASCASVDVTHTNCWLQFPVTMRSAVTMAYTAGFATPTSTTQATLGACSALANAQTVSGAIPTIYGALMNCTATTIPAAGVASFFYANSGSGVISASAEL